MSVFLSWLTISAVWLASAVAVFAVRALSGGPMKLCRLLHAYYRRSRRVYYIACPHCHELIQDVRPMSHARRRPSRRARLLRFQPRPNLRGILGG